MLFLHVGLQKTGTSFLQQAVFPKWKGVSFIRADLEVLLRMDPSNTYLVSREGLSGRNWDHHDVREKSLERLAGLFPESRLLVSFRKHSGYIVSSYRQYIQRGGSLSFDEYFDLDGDRGFMKKADFYFRTKTAAIERFFGHVPFVFCHEELKRDLEPLLADLESYIGGRAPRVEEISMKQINKSIGYYPAQLLRRLNAVTKSELNPDGAYDLNKASFERFTLSPRIICQRWLSFLPSPRFVSESQAADIDEFYRDDWNHVLSYVSNRRERAGGCLD